MNIVTAVETIQSKFRQSGSEAQVALLTEGSFTARVVDGGIEVDNLGNLPFLPWAAFQEAVCTLIRNGGRAERGHAMGSRLGDPGLSLDSVEGHVAHVVYGKRVGEAVFRRITPIACILIWAGICVAVPNELRLREPL